MKIEINYDDKVVTGELIKDSQFLGGYKVVYENHTSSILIVDLVDKTILEGLELSQPSFVLPPQNQTLYRIW